MESCRRGEAKDDSLGSVGVTIRLNGTYCKIRTSYRNGSSFTVVECLSLALLCTQCISSPILTSLYSPPLHCSSPLPFSVFYLWRECMLHIVISVFVSSIFLISRGWISINSQLFERHDRLFACTQLMDWDRIFWVSDMVLDLIFTNRIYPYSLCSSGTYTSRKQNESWKITEKVRLLACSISYL